MSVPKRRAEAPAEKRPEKKQKSDKSKDKSRPAQSHSVLRDEEAAFPRGGANTLTPLEHRQIQIKAKQDVLFEQSTGKKAPATFDSDDEAEVEITEEQAHVAAKASKRDKKSKRKEGKGQGSKDQVADDGLKIEGLSYKRLIPGSIVLGQVSSINKYDVSVTLPNSLTGYLPLTSISDKLTQTVEALAEQEAASNDEEDDSAEEDDIKLADYLQIGQYLRVCVTKIGTDDKNEKSKRHIALSAIPQQVNGGLSKSDLIKDNMVQASVDSVEDHGVIMSVGLEEDGIKGFMATSDIHSNTSLSDLKTGAVFMCLVLGTNPNGKTVKLSANTEKMGNLKKGGFLTDAPSVDTFLPGCAVDVLVSEVTEAGLVGKVMGMVDVTADWIHSARDLEQKPLAKRHPVGSQIKARVICTFPASGSKKLGVSLLPHILSLKTQTPKKSDELPEHALPTASTIEAKVVNVESPVGLILDVGVKGVPGFAHISRLSDEKVATISSDSGPYKLGTSHRARVIGYNALDGHFLISLQDSILKAAFLRLEDVPVGAVVETTVNKIVSGVSGKVYVVLDLGGGITGHVPEEHLSDVLLHNPERKYKVGGKVSARVLHVDAGKQGITLSCKKSLVNSDAPVWRDYADPKIGEQAPGTIVKLSPSGAVVRFYGPVKAFLPAAQMSESFVKDPQQHFHVGQVVTVHPVSIDSANEKMTVSCRDPSSFGPQHQKALDAIKVGQTVDGTVSEKLQDRLVVELAESGLKGTLLVEHLSDGSASKCANAAKMIRVGQTLHGLLVLQKNQNSQTLQLSNKSTLLKAVRSDKFPNKLEDLNIGGEVVGFVSNITTTAVFVKFGAGLSGLLPRSGLLDEAAANEPDFGLRRAQTISAKVSKIDTATDRFYLTQKETTLPDQPPKQAPKGFSATGKPLKNPVDGVSKLTTDFEVGTVTKAKILSVKDTQLNVILADEVQGRIDVSQAFDSWDDIKNHKRPLSSFSNGQILPVRILGSHDHRNHRFLPISHTGKSQVFELTARTSDLAAKQLKPLTTDKVRQGREYICYVNNITNSHLWVNITPNVRGRIGTMDVSDNVTQLTDIEGSFPLGCALRARVTNVDSEKGHIDLSAKSGSSAPKELSDLTVASVLAAKVLRVTERQLVVALSETVQGPVNLVDLADDYSEADPSKFAKGQTVRVHVSKVDLPNKRLTLSTRRSKTLSSTLAVTDRDYKDAGELHLNDIVRGFIKNITDKGIFVALSNNVTAFVAVRQLSDNYTKDWQSEYEVDNLVKGKVINIDAEAGRIQLSLKKSVLDIDYKAPLSWYDLKAGLIVTGKVREVKPYGVFIVVDNSNNVSGLCHRSEMADERVEDVSALYSVGDAVKAKVLKVNLNKQKRELSFGLKASYFEDKDGMEVDVENHSDDDDLDSDGNGGVEVAPHSGDTDEEVGDLDLGGANLDAFNGLDDADSDDEGIDVTSAIKGVADGQDGVAFETAQSGGGLNVGGFDWFGKRPQESTHIDSESDSDAEPQKKKRRKAQIQVDRTAELDINGPQSTADFERLLMSEPNSSTLWVTYMAYYLNLNDVTKAREIAERAIKTVNHQRRETEEDALNVWVAYLNLENTYGNDETLEAVFARAKQYNDAKETHNRLASIYIQSGKNEQADALFQTMVKKFSQDPAVWLNYAAFLFDTTKQPVQARELLKRALQALPKNNQLDTTIKFAQLEFARENGETERGRTMFEGLISTFPKRTDLYNVYLDLEIKVGDKDTIRRLFQRSTASNKLKPKQARYFFKRWEEWEEKNGDAKSMERVRAKAVDWVNKHTEEKGAK